MAEQEEFDFAKNGKGTGSTAPKKQKKITPEMALNNRGDGVLKQMVDRNFLDYASYVIKDRAIPNLEDGVKPVQRRILWALHRNDDGKFIKVANIVGYTMQFHPHGDASIADALVNLTNKRYLIEGQGNFGNIYTGDPAAASRYIECRLTDLARNELFNHDLTAFIPSYDGRNKEPVLLPAKIPLLLMLGAEGIAVGLSTKILPHNFIELLDAMITVLQKKPMPTLVPDFLTGGLMDASEYDEGRGKIKLRAIIEEKEKSGLVIKEIPYGTTTESIINSIENAIRKKKIKVRSIHDFTAESVEIHLTLSPGEDQEKTMRALYAFTDCEVSVSSNLLCIQDHRPVEMSVPEVIRFYAQQLKQILEKELELEKQRLENEIHHKTLVQIFIENRIYKDIEEQKTYEAVQQAVLEGVLQFRSQLRRDVTQEDVEMLLQVRIKKISRFDIEKSKKEIGDMLKKLEEVEKHLKQLTRYAVRYVKGLIKKYSEAYPRLTRLDSFEQISAKEVIAADLKMSYDASSGYVGHTVRGETQCKVSALDKVVLVWKDGRYKVCNPPDKMFVNKDLIYCALYERDKVMTAVYTNGPITYFKKFKFGGAILDREYRIAPEKSKILLYDDTNPSELYVKYKPAKNQRINQQLFDLSELIVKGAKAKGNQMTVKKIHNLGTKKLRNWDEEDTHSTNASKMDL